MTKQDLELIEEISSKLDLNLTGKTVLTEAGSGHFGLIGLIAGLNNAKKVICWSSDSAYGTAKDNIKAVQQKIKEWNIQAEYDFAINEKPTKHIKEADIITNSGFTRPFDKNFLDQMNQDAVIPIMMEAWELRSSDIDLEYAKKKGIQVAGTWENHPELKIFDQCGPLSSKLIGDSGFDLSEKKVLIISSDHFGSTAEKEFKEKYNCQILIVHPENMNEFDDYNYDLIFIADFSFTGEIVGPNSNYFQSNHVSRIPVVHLCGHVDLNFTLKKGINIFPEMEGLPKKMTKTLAYLGSKPVIQLHAAGLKVGELLLKKESSSLVQKL